MLGSPALTGTSSSSADSRIFVYEVEGLGQAEYTPNNSYPARNSSKVIMHVPYRSMNDEMRRVTRLGGKIVNIRPLDEHSSES